MLKSLIRNELQPSAISSKALPANNPSLTSSELANATTQPASNKSPQANNSSQQQQALSNGVVVNNKQSKSTSAATTLIKKEATASLVEPKKMTQTVIGGDASGDAVCASNENNTSRGSSDKNAFATNKNLSLENNMNSSSGCSANKKSSAASINNGGSGSQPRPITPATGANIQFTSGSNVQKLNSNVSLCLFMQRKTFYLKYFHLRLNESKNLSYVITNQE